MRLTFAGSGSFGLPTLDRLHRDHTLALVITQPDKPAGRKRKLTATPVGRWAADHDIPTLKTDDANAPDAVARVADAKPDASVVIAFGQKLSPQLIAAMGRLAVNLHASLLPKYRGAAPINWAMIRGERETGVSVIALAQRMDAGHVYATAATPIDPLETAGELHDRLATLGPDAIAKVLQDLERDRLTPIPQNDTEATKAPKLNKEDGTTAFDLPADQVRNRIHGLTPWPACRVNWTHHTTHETHPLTLRRAKVVTPPTEAQRPQSPGPGTVRQDLTIACAPGSGTTLQLLEVQPPNKPPMPSDAFKNGHDFTPGDTLSPLT